MKRDCTVGSIGRVATLAVAISLAACGDSPQQAVARAQADLAAGNAAQAVVRLRDVLQSHPEAGDVRLLLGQVLLERGDALTAVKELRKAFDSGVETETVKPLLVRALLESGEYKTVLADFPAQQIRSPEARAEVLVSQAYAQLADGHPERAREVLAEARAASPGNLRLAVADAVLLGIAGDQKAASAAIDQLVTKHPTVVDVLRAKSIIAQGSGDLPAAIEAQKTLVSLRPFDSGAQSRLAMLFWAAGKTDDVRTQWVAMKKSLGVDHPATAYLGALLSAHDKDFRAARDQIARALKFNPDSAPALLLSGIVNSELGGYELAESHLNKLLAKEPDHLVAQQALIGVLMKTKRVDHALALAKEIVAKHPQQPRALLLAASVYLGAGDAKKAQALFERATAAGGADARALTGLALARIATGDESKAVDALLQASAADDLAIEADYLLVNHFLARKEFDRAIETVGRIAAKRRGEPRILILEGDVLMAAGRTGEAKAAFERAYEQYPDLVVATLRLADVDRLQGQPLSQVKKRFEDAMARRPKDAQLLVAYAFWLEKNGGDRESMRVLLEKAVAVAPTDVDARLSLIGLHVVAKDVPRALLLAEEANKAIPANRRLMTLLADLQLKSGKPEAAVATLNKAIELEPNAADLHVRLADVQLIGGARGVAVGSLRKALSLKGDHRPAKIRLVALGEAPGTLAEVIEAARELQRTQPDAAIGYWLEGMAYGRANQWAQAVPALRAGVERAKTPQLVVALYSALLAVGKADDAAAVVRNWQQANPKDAYVRIGLADRALAAKDYPTAIRTYKDVLADYPESPRLLNNLAWAAARIGDPAAFEYAERAANYAPKDANVLETLGTILIDRGQLARGVEVLQRASAAAPEAPHIRFSLAKALLKAGDTRGARRELEALAKLGDKYPQHAEVRKLLARL